MEQLHSVFPSLSAELSKDIYVEKLRTLLFIEEFTAMQDCIILLIWIWLLSSLLCQRRHILVNLWTTADKNPLIKQPLFVSLNSTEHDNESELPCLLIGII